MKIHCNNVPRPYIYGSELTKKERADFDYIDAEELETRDFVRYKGRAYDIGEFMRAPPGGVFGKFEGYSSESFFSGVLFKSVGSEHCIMATYCS